MEQLLGVQVAGAGPHAGYVRCPLHAVCGWQTVDRTHLGWIVVVDGPASDAAGELVTRRVDAVEHVNRELLDHLAGAHLEHLQLLLAAVGGVPGGEQQVVQVTMQLDPETVRRAPEGVPVDHVVERLRTRLAAELTRQQMRPLDPWPAVTVRRMAWSAEYGNGLRELDPEDPQQPDLWQLELRTRALPDLQPVLLEP